MPDSTPALTLKWSGSTDRGKVRPHNEDAFIGLQFDARELHHLGRMGQASLQASDLVFAVSDGMGGALAGEFASRIAVDKITQLLPRTFIQSAAGLEAGRTEVLPELFAQIHRALVYVGRSYEECAGMETTLSLCWFTPGWMYFAHIGDSRIYYLPAGESTIKQISHDDTYVGWLYRNGKLNEREARNHPRRNVLQKALGGGNQFVDPQVGRVDYAAGDIFLLCTDGLVEGLPDSNLEAIMRQIQVSSTDDHTAQRLVTTSVERDGRDNTTAIVIRVESSPGSSLEK